MSEARSEGFLASGSASDRDTLAVKTGRTLWVGFNDDGQPGDATTANRSTPVRVGTDTHWTQVAAGWNHSVAVRS